MSGEDLMMDRKMEAEGEVQDQKEISTAVAATTTEGSPSFQAAPVMSVFQAVDSAQRKEVPQVRSTSQSDLQSQSADSDSVAKQQVYFLPPPPPQPPLNPYFGQQHQHQHQHQQQQHQQQIPQNQEDGGKNRFSESEPAVSSASGESTATTATTDRFFENSKAGSNVINADFRLQQMAENTPGQVLTPRPVSVPKILAPKVRVPFLYPQETLPTVGNYNFYEIQEDDHYGETSGSIPTIELDKLDSNLNDPILIAEKFKEIGSKYGAIKIIPSKKWNAKVYKSSINDRHLWFQTRRQLLNSKKDEMDLRIFFYNRLFKSLRQNADPNNHLKNLPNIENEPVDLYRLAIYAKEKIQSSKICEQKLWKEIANELGYFAKPLAPEKLKEIYEKILKNFDLSELELEKCDSINENNKRVKLEQDESEAQRTKKLKLEDDELIKIPVLYGSAYEYKRSRNLLISKGFPTNFDALTIEKQGISKSDKTSLETYNFHDWLKNDQAGFKFDIIDPSSYLNNKPPFYNIRDFYEKNLKFQKKIFSKYKFDDSSSSSSSSNLTPQKLEDAYWRFVEEQDPSNLYEVEAAIRVPTAIHDSGFYQIGSNSGNLEQNLENLVDEGLGSWNLNNLAINDQSIFRFLSNDIQSLTKPTLNIGMLFSTENWTMEDHWLHLIDYNHYGNGKIWYFIDPNDYENFEKLLKDCILKRKDEYKSNEYFLNPTKFKENFNDPDFISCCLENRVLSSSVANPLNKRFEHRDKFYNGLINTNQKIKFNDDFFLTPEFLKSKGIRVYKTYQKAGEFIIKYPKCYSSNICLGFTKSESINFAPPSWLGFGEESENWLVKQGIMPNFSIFEILINIAKNNVKNIAILQESKQLYENLLKEELTLRNELRNKVQGLKEVTNTNDNYISDDDLAICFPSKVILCNNDDRVFSISIKNFLKYSKKDSFLKKLKSVELHIFYDDEKLKSFGKVFNRDIPSSSKWFEKFQNFLKSSSMPSLKSLKNLYFEGEKIFNDDYLKFFYNKEKEYKIYSTFIRLGQLIERYQSWVDSAQKYLSSKHQSRTRNNLNRKRFNNNLNFDIDEYNSTNVDGTDQNDDVTVDEEAELNIDGLCKLVEDISGLFFYSEEIDQLLNLTNEIEKYELNARKFLSSSTNYPNFFKENIEELSNIVSLGRSFGFYIPSASKLAKIYKIETWLLKYEEIFSEGLLSKFKDIFSFKKFIDEGKTLMSQGHNDKISRLEGKLKETEILADSVAQIINKTHKSNISEVSKLLEESYDYPIDAELRNQLIKIKSEYEDIMVKSEKFLEKLVNIDGEINEDTLPKYSQVKSLLEKTKHLKFNSPQVKKLEVEYFKPTEEWLKNLRKFCNKQNSSLMVLKTYLVNLLNNVNNCLNISNPEDIVDFNNSPNVSSNEKFFCLCRLMESGSMVECENCSEWYHLSCFNTNKSKMKDKNFICPICDHNHNFDDLFLNFNKKFNNLSKPNLSNLILLLNDFKKLKLYPPMEEYNLVKEAVNNCLKFKQDFLNKDLKWDENFEMIIEDNIYKVRFYLRKLTGCSILFEKEYNQLREILLLLDEKKAQEQLRIKQEQDELVKIQTTQTPQLNIDNRIETTTISNIPEVQNNQFNNNKSFIPNSQITLPPKNPFEIKDTSINLPISREEEISENHENPVILSPLKNTQPEAINKANEQGKIITQTNQDQ
ncbi:hypothetical protein PACTADRAFT_82096 [Pachysolen tannophilus NRRL Y-2460]|uniref:Uncharacterized protein n=1 Tax=Pachysolen tannophilus NRRL Y-2460 TaxID=669874 RepID=A0A1E4TP86_PACTA|nr:hypothetical protein PACTADRAFT_82096 [Pachysolen tannophilus NRRL Y-2460]